VHANQARHTHTLAGVGAGDVVALFDASAVHTEVRELTKPVLRQGQHARGADVSDVTDVRIGKQDLARACAVYLGIQVHIV
jgi:hypothetical protein